MKLEQYGADHGKTILCIPGTFMAGSCFLPLAEQMPDCQLLCVTLDGHHEGGRPFLSLEQEVETLVKLLRARGTTRIDLALGLSLGTVVTLELAARRELQIDKLVLDGAVNLYTSKNQTIERMMTMAYLSLFQQSFKRKAKKQAGKGKKPELSEWDLSWQKAAPCVSRQSLRNIIGELVRYTPSPGLTQPIYLLYGDKEHNYTACCEAACRCFPEVHIDIKKGHNHLTWLASNPKSYARMLYGVMARGAGRAPKHT